MDNDALLFEKCLHAVESGQYTPEQCVTRYLTHKPEIESALRLALSARAVTVPDTEMDAARDRIRELLDSITSDDVLRGPANLGTLEQRKRRWTMRPRRGQLWRTWACAAAAILVVSSLLGWRLAAASAVALPGSPLYEIKRGQEWVALHTAWSDERRGQLLAIVASRRLTEAHSEAILQNEPLVRSLTTACDWNVQQLIKLTEHMTAQHENTTVVAAGLAGVLHDEYVTLQSAQHAGQSVLVASLSSVTQAQRQAIQQSSIVLPNGATPTPSTPPGATPNPAQGGTSQGGTSQGSPVDTGTPPPDATPPGQHPVNGNGNSNQGNNRTNGNGHSGHSGNEATATPTPTPSPTPASSMPNRGAPTRGAGRLVHPFLEGKTQCAHRGGAFTTKHIWWGRALHPRIADATKPTP